MADKKISALTAATTPLDGTEVLPIVQSGSTVKVANNDLRPKQIQSNATSGVLQITGPAASATRVMTVPNANFTAARTDAAQTFTGTQTFSSDMVVNSFTVGRGAGNINGNVAYGPSALAANTTGYDNYASGFFALAANQDGIRNAAAGSYALQANTSGSYNTAFGRLSLFSCTTGSNNFAIGYNSGNDTVRTITTQSNEGVLGNNDTTAIYAKVSITVTSDVRDKTEINPVPFGLDFVNAVTPISFKFKKSRDDSTPTGRVILGFSAQEVLALQGGTQIVDDSDPDHLKINNQDLIAVLFNAVKQLSQEVEMLKSQISK